MSRCAATGELDDRPRCTATRQLYLSPLPSHQPHVPDPLQHSAPPSRVLKIIRVHPLQRDGAHGGHADAILDHELGEPLAVDEDDLVRDAPGVIERVFVEVAGGDEDALRGMLPRQRADETLARTVVKFPMEYAPRMR